MNVVYTFDDGYTMITAVSLVSLYENNKEIENLKTYIVDCGINENNKKIIESIGLAYSRDIIFVPAIDLESKIPTNLDVAYWSTVCYVRLFFAEMFPNLDRVMHIDCDTIVRGPLLEVYETELEDNICAACYDCVAASKRKLGLAKEKPYLSNGFIIFDLEKIRNFTVESKFVDYIVTRKGNLPHLDQDVLSAVIGEKTTILHPKYNLMTITAAYGGGSLSFFEKGDPYYTFSELEEAASEPVIIHYVGNRFMSRPWVQPCYHPYNDEWIKYYKITNSINGSVVFDTNRKIKNARNAAGYIWNIGFKIGIIRKIELLMDIGYYRKKGKHK